MPSEISIKMSKGREVLFLIALFLVNTIFMTDFVVFTITDVYYAMWPDNTGMVNFILSGPYAFIVIGGLIAPFLMKHIDKKILLSVVCVAFAITSIGGCLMVEIPYMVVCRSIGGLCYGIGLPLQMGIVADVCIDEVKRAKVIGWVNAAMQLVGAVMSYVAGTLAATAWQNVYHTYWLAAVMVVFVILFIPKLKDAKAAAQDAKTVERDASGAIVDSETGDEPAKNGYMVRFVAILINMMLACVIFSIPFLNFIAVFVQEQGLGNAQFAGTLLSVNTIAALVSCLFFGKLYGKMRSYTNILLYSGLAVALAIEYFFPSMVAAVVAEALGGACFSCAFTYTMTEGSVIMPASKVDSAFAIVTVCNGIAGFGYNYIATWLMDVMGTSLVTPQYGVYVVVAIAVVIIEVSSSVWFAKKNKTVAVA